MRASNRGDAGEVLDLLVLSDQPDLVDHLLALASASGFSVEVAAAPELAMSWSRARLVVLGADVLDRVADAGLPRRADVVVFGEVDEHDWRRAFEVGATAVVAAPGPVGWLADRLGQSVHGDRPRAVGKVIGVVGGRGGAGASVFAAALAVRAAKGGQRPFLLDLDPMGCGARVILGRDQEDGLTWDLVRAGEGRIPSHWLDSAVAVVDGIRLLGWSAQAGPRLPDGVAGSVVDAARLCGPVTLIDLARATTGFQREALSRCDRVLLVVPADVRAVHATRRLLARQELSMCEVVVRGPNPGGLSSADIGQALGLPVLAAVAADRGLDRRLERGEPPGLRARTPLARAATGILAEVLQ
jgi:secretion/DNA translocation related CpaE-like protein